MAISSPFVPPSGFRGVFRSDDDARAVYSEAAGIGRTLPRAIAVPVDPDDLRILVQWAARSHTPLVPRGSGSSMAGGAIGDGVIVDLSRWCAIGPVDRVGRFVRVEPGVIRDDVDRAAREHGLRFPVDPSSGAFCTVGGMASTNAAGAHSLHFGSVRPWVRAIDCLFADGSRALVRRGDPLPAGIAAIRELRGALTGGLRDAERTRPSVHAGVRKDSSGYAVAAFAESGDLIDLLVGSEGTLAIFLSLELSLAPAAGATSSVFGAFDSLESAVIAAGRASVAGAVACELLDKTFLEIAGRAGPEAALLAEVEGADAAGAEGAAREVERIFGEAGAATVRVALDAPTERELWELRHAASPILARLDPALRSMQFIEDGAVPPENLPQYVRGVRAALARNGTRGVIFGHAGDAHVHVNPLVDVSGPDWRDRVSRILDEVTALASSLGGTLTGEHGDGRIRTPLLESVWSAEALEHFARVKQCFDPAGILNPGVKVPLPGQRALGEIKYDPALPALPIRARNALAIVEEQRAYASYRLALLDA